MGQPRESVESTQPSAAWAEHVVDIDLALAERRRQVGTLHFLLYMLTLAGVQALAVQLGADLLPCIGVLAVSGAFGWPVTALHIWARNGDEFATAVSERVPPEVLARAAADCRREARLASALAQQGRLGLTIRIGAELAPIEPLQVPFEPTAVIEGERGFEQLRAGTDGDAADEADSPSGFGQGIPQPVLFVLGVGSVVVMYLCWQALIAGQWTLRMAGVPAVLLGIILGYVLAWVVRRVRQGHGLGDLHWLIIPRGVLVGVPGEMRVFSCDDSVLVARQHARVRWILNLARLFSRDDSLLVAWQHTRTWTVYLAQPGRSEMRVVTDGELDGVLKAWLSPLPAPPRERLHEFLRAE